jgi:hypothetical protein
VTVRGLTVVDAPSYGIYGRRSRLSVIDCTVQDSADIGIFIETTATTAADISGCVVSNCTVDRTGIAAASIAEGGIKAHGYGAGPYEVIGTQIIGNTVRLPEEPDDGTAICIEAYGGSPQSVVANNTTFGGAMGISVGGADWSAINGNTIYRADAIGIECAATRYAAVSGNAINGDELTNRGIAVSNSPNDGVAISGNVITSIASASIFADAASMLAITGNQIEQATAGYGIELNGCECVAISGNVLDGGAAGDKAIMLAESGTVTVAGNTMRDWTENGVLVFGDSAVTIDYLTIQANTFDNCNVDYGTQLSGGAALGTHVHVQVPTAAPDYTLSGLVADRTFDPTSTNDAEVAQVLATVISDLIGKGIFT